MRSPRWASWVVVITKCVAELEVESVCWCVREKGHRGDGVVDNGVMPEIVHKCCNSVDQPVKEE